MFRNYLITFWRNIIKNGVFSIINIFGLAIGLMSCILIMLFVRQESGFDSWLKDSDRLVRMHTTYSFPNQEIFDTVRSPGRMMPAIREYAKTEIETGVRLIQLDMTVRQNEEAFSEEFTVVDGSFFNLFDLPFIHGSKESSFNKPMDLVISEEMAYKYFGKSDVIGETLTVCCLATNTMTLTITGVMKDLPEATHLNADLLVYLQPSMFSDRNNILNTWTSVNVYSYFKLNHGVKITELQQRINYWLNNESPLTERFAKNAPSGTVTEVFQLKLMAVPDLHLQAKRDAGSMGDLTPMGDKNMIITFIIVAALVLLIACINFMNLSTAKASKRAREVAMRKVLGASRAQVAIQFLGEAIALVFLSLLFALVAVELVLPFYNELLGKDLALLVFDDPSLLLILMLGAIFVGIGAGIYPALYLSRFLPGQILKSSKSVESKNSAKFRSILVIFQFSTSIILVISTLVVYGQTIFSKTMDVGYESDNKLVLNIRSAGDNLTSLKQELLNLPEVASVTFSSEAPSQDNENNDGFMLLEPHIGGVANQSLSMNKYNMGYGFFEAYNVKPLAGRFFDENFGTDTIKTAAEGEVGQSSADT